MRKTAARGGPARRGRSCLLYTLLAFAAVNVGVFLFRDTWTSYDPNEYHERLVSCRRQGWDLVLVGGSAMAEDVDPARLSGLAWRGTALNRVFNLGLAGAPTTGIWHAVEHGVGAPPPPLVSRSTASDLNDNRDEPNGRCPL